MEGNISARPSSSTPTVRLFAFGRHLRQLWSGERADDVLGGNCAVNVRSEGVNKELRARNQRSPGNRGGGSARHRGEGWGIRVLPDTNHLGWCKEHQQHHICPIYSLWAAFGFSLPSLSLCLCDSHSSVLHILWRPPPTPTFPRLPVSHRRCQNMCAGRLTCSS